MLKHWEDDYDEPEVVRAFHDAWGGRPFCRAQLGAGGFGGTPDQNNALEGKNGGQKGDVDNERQQATQAVYTLSSWVQNESVSDNIFGFSLNDSAWNRTLFKNAVHIKEKTNLLETSTQFSPAGSSFLHGTLMPSVQVIDLLVNEYGIPPDDTDGLWRALTRTASGDTRGSWVGTFRRLVLNPVQTVSGQPAC
jgi:hypothetical protein